MPRRFILLAPCVLATSGYQVPTLLASPLAFAPQRTVAPAAAMVMPNAQQGRRNMEIEGLRDQVWQLREDGLDIHLTVVREIEAEISRLQLEDALDHFAFCSTALRIQRPRTVANAACLAGSLVAVFSALRNYILLAAASFYATQGANVASQLTGTLRSLPGERLAPIVGRVFGRFIIGREYAPWTRGKGTGKGKGLGYNFVRR